MAIVDGGHTVDRTGDVIEDAVDHVRRDVEPCHAGRRRPPKIVQDPGPDLSFSRILAGLLELRPKQLEHVPVKPLLGFAETGYRPLAVRREQVGAELGIGTVGTRSRYFRHLTDDRQGEFGKMDLVSAVVSLAG